MAKSVLKDTMTALNKMIAGLETSSSSGAVKEDLERLANKLSMMVMDDPDLPLQNLRVRTWLVRLLDTVIALYELVEKVAADDHSSQTMWSKFFFFFSGGRGSQVQHTESIKKIEDALDHLQRSKRSLPSNRNANNSGGSQGALKLEFHGRQVEEKKITQQLLSNSDTHSPIILPIVGIKGLGKTALARHVYDNDLFELKDWVQSGESFNGTSIVNSIKQKLHQVPQLPSYGHRQDGQSEATGGRKYLLVLDDVKSVDPNEWDHFRRSLPSCCSILITTPSVVVARITATVPPLDLQGLNEDDSWFLFKRITSSPSSSFYEESQDSTKEREMVLKCKGVPLAIQIMGSLWLKYFHCFEEDKFLEKLALIYLRELSSPLKLCFALCSLFSDDDLIDIPRLINLWIGERYVLPRYVVEYEGVGKEYFHHLHGRSIFQDLQEDELGNPISCRMHPLMHYLADFVAGDEYISFSSVHPDSVEVKETVHHASFDFKPHASAEIPTSLSDKLLTIFLPAEEQSGTTAYEKMSNSTLKNMFKFKNLCVLDLHDLGIKTVPSSICNLRQLRYLDLSRNKMKELPDSITKLEHLQTLKLSNCKNLTKLPQDLHVLTRLRHLEIDKCRSLGYTECIKDMTSLRTLSTLDSIDFWKSSRRGNASSVSGLANLNKLRGVLEIAQLQCCVASDIAEAKLQHKLHLECLILRWEPHCNNAINADGSSSSQEKFLESLDPPKNLKALSLMGYGGTKLSHWLSRFSELQHLVKFSLSNCGQCKSLQSLYYLQSLKILKLYNLSSLKYIVDNESSKEEKVLACLKKLTISNCEALTGWWEKEVPLNRRPSFPNISVLEVKFCPKLKCMPLCGGLDEKLVVENSSVKPILPDTIKCPTKSKYPAFSKLKTMQIDNKNTSSQGQPPKNWLHNFTCLQRLHLVGYSHLKYLHEGFSCLVSLEHLTIEYCNEQLDLMKETRSDAWVGLKNLRSLTIKAISRLERLPKGLECVTTLQDLHLHDCPCLLSDNIDKLVSLQTFVISKCPSLDFQPQVLKSLSSRLATFTIDGSRPQSVQRKRHL